MRPIAITGAALVLATSLAACSSSGKPLARPTLASKAPLPGGLGSRPATAPAPISSGSASTTIDPCQLMTQAEASQLTGVAYGPGKEEVDPGGGRRCIYGAQTHNVFEMIVVQASTVEQAQAVKTELLAQLGAKVPLTHVPGVGDDAQALQTSMSLSGGTLYVGALYVLQGTVGFAIVDETNNSSGCPGTAALVSQAQTAIGRLP